MNDRKQDDDSLDLFPTPPWTTRAAIHEILSPMGFPLADSSVVDPCVGKGHMLLPLQEAFGRVHYFDIYDWGINAPLADFTAIRPGEMNVDWVFANPPFKYSEAFFHQAMRVSSVGVAFLVRLSWLCGKGRHGTIYDKTPPTQIAFSAERIAMIEGVWDPNASTATDYVWCFWVHGEKPRPPMWFQPGMQAKYTLPSDFALATPGEAKRRLAAKKEEAKRQRETEAQQAVKAASSLHFFNPNR